jgi:hypothetical protein
MLATHECVDYGTGETFVTAQRIARDVGHAHPTRVYDAWAKAASLGLMTRPYAKPNEPRTRHYRRLLMMGSWRETSDLDGGRRQRFPSEENDLLRPGSDESPDKGINPPPLGESLHDDRSHQPSFYPNSEREQDEPTSRVAADGADPIDQSTTPPAVAPPGALAEDLPVAGDPLGPELVSRGVSPADARVFMQRYPADRIRRQLGNFDQQRAKGTNLASRRLVQQGAPEELLGCGSSTTHGGESHSSRSKIPRTQRSARIVGKSRSRGNRFVRASAR